METQIAFLRRVAPFNLLPENVLGDLARMMERKEYASETTVYTQDESEVTGVEVIVSGEYNAFFYDSEKILKLQEHYDSGAIYGASSVLLNKKKSIRTVVAQAGTVVLVLDKAEFKALCRSFDDFFHHFTEHYGQKLLNDEYAHFVQRNTTREGNFIDADLIFTRRLNTIFPRQLVTCPPETTVQEVAAMMVEKELNCMYVEEDGEIRRIITKDILIKKVLAAGLPGDMPVKKVARKKFVTMHKDALLYDALLALFQSEHEFVLVTDGERYLGYLSRYRLLTEHAQSPLVFIQSVRLSNTVGELKDKWQKVPALVATLLERGVNAEIVNRIVTTINDEILLRVIEGVKDEMPPAPARFAFMVMGSEGRREQTLVTDQDNAIIYEDKANEQRELVREYFLEFANRISTNLNEIGFSYCDGGFMAKNPKWTHSLSHWKRNYEQWINESIPETVIKFATFFDCRFVFGEKKLFNELKEYMVTCLEKSTSKFMYSLASNALHFEPQLTLFNSIRTFSKDERKVFDIKKSMTPIVDLVRMLALKNKVIETNTGRRMQKLHERGFLNDNQYKELMHAYYYMMGMRLKNQTYYILEEFVEPTNLVEPQTLTKVEQMSLREIFKFIKDFQTTIHMEFKV
ncbi:DUF294 nucleotidyltransferase-like domain-containing protein [Mangrovibacterium diazotrophicum]|uniref:CBS domain-containing protein n=1 Tax=Mangrovibacterium diazotrophicum TaxID=1261403 RepID=A0A419WB50_9BACT|nr:DUF294 nucleotidyltransferase-like domain-containing protein [Mangrovibacterium diazotrophicum]RKD92710.1 CBS domain-containing protein [Mangrovibacterium diazotrophicum]